MSLLGNKTGDKAGKKIKYILSLLLLAGGGAGVVSRLGMIDLPISLPESIAGFPSLYIFGGAAAIGLVILIFSMKSTY